MSKRFQIIGFKGSTQEKYCSEIFRSRYGKASNDKRYRTVSAPVSSAIFPPLLEIRPVYAKLATAFFPRCKTTKTMCSEFSATEDSLPASKSIAPARV